MPFFGRTENTKDESHDALGISFKYCRRSYQSLNGSPDLGSRYDPFPNL